MTKCTLVAITWDKTATHPSLQDFCNLLEQMSLPPHFVSPFSGPACSAQTPGLPSLHDIQENRSSVGTGRKKKNKISKELEGVDRVTGSCRELVWCWEWRRLGTRQYQEQEAHTGLCPTARLARMMLKWKVLEKNRARNLAWRISKGRSRFLVSYELFLPISDTQQEQPPHTEYLWGCSQKRQKGCPAPSFYFASSLARMGALGTASPLLRAAHLWTWVSLANLSLGEK